MFARRFKTTEWCPLPFRPVAEHLNSLDKNTVPTLVEEV
jgi:hypothetical protein